MLVSSESVKAQSYDFTWKKTSVKARKTGVTPSNASNVKQSMGQVRWDTYYAPNGKVYYGGATAKAASIILAAQDRMAPIKRLVAHSAKEMVKHSPECELSNWAVDFIMSATEELTGKHVDMGVTNFGGIRVDMPEGDVLEDDLRSMFPFKNALCLVSLKGSKIREILENMAATSFQAIGGVRVVVQDRKLISAEIGGQPIDDDKVYNLATIDFLLDGGDRLHLGNDAIEMTNTGVYIIDALLPYVEKLEAEGKMIDAEIDGRVTILPSAKK